MRGIKILLSLLLTASAVLLRPLPPARSGPPDPADEKLLLGFEEEEFARIGKAIKITRQEGKNKEGKPYVAWESPGGFAPLGSWMTYKGDASEGQYALGIGLVTNQ